MYSSHAIKRGLKNPVFTIKAIFYYLLFAKDIRYIKNSLRSKFTKEEISRYSTGASAGLKEVAIYLIIRRYKPKFMIETGVAQGVSTYFILKAMKKNGFGRLTSIDKPNYQKKGYKDAGGSLDRVYIPDKLKSGWLVPKEFRSNWKLLIGTSKEMLPKIDEKIDIFFHDSDHSYENMKFELEWAMKRVGRDGVIMADDTERNSAFKEIIEKYKKKVEQINVPISTLRIVK